MATSRGRLVAAGVGAHERLLGVRTTPYEMWSPLRMLKTDVGHGRLRELHGAAIDDVAFQRVVAYLSQAETFYLSAETMPTESRPLVAYYFFLNMTKALLTCLEPALTAQKAAHGLRDSFQKTSRYWFQHEVVTVGQPTTPARTNIFMELAHRTGAGQCYPAATELPIHKLAPYLVETADLLEDAVAIAPKLLPIEEVRVLGRDGYAWLQIEVRSGELRRRAIPSHDLTNRATHFGAVFREVAPTGMLQEAYESQERWSYRARPGRVSYARCAPDVIAAFERSLIHTNRGTTGARHLIVLSRRMSLLSQEAVAFLVMHHLSNMVRYRPEQVGKLTAASGSSFSRPGYRAPWRTSSWLRRAESFERKLVSHDWRVTWRRPHNDRDVSAVSAVSVESRRDQARRA